MTEETLQVIPADPVLLAAERSEKQAELFKALAACQAEFDTIQAAADNEYFHSKYAPLYALWEHARPILKKHGLLLIQEPMPSTVEEGAKIRNTLAHTSGEWRSSVIVIPVDLGKEGKGKKAPAYGSAYTYARRYGMGGILGLATSAEDNDAGTTDPDFNAGQSESEKGWRAWVDLEVVKLRECDSRLELQKRYDEASRKMSGQQVPPIVQDLLDITYNRRAEELKPASKKAADPMDPEGDVPQ